MKSLKYSLIVLAALGLIGLASPVSMAQDGQPHLVTICYCQIDPNDPIIMYEGVETCEDIEKWYLELDGQCVYDVEWRY